MTVIYSPYRTLFHIPIIIMPTFIEHVSLDITKLVLFVVYAWFMYYVLTSPWRVDKWFRSNSGWQTLIKTTVLRVSSGILSKHASTVTAEACVTSNVDIHDEGQWIVKQLATAVVMGTYIILVRTIEHMYRVVEDLREKERVQEKQK